MALPSIFDKNVHDSFIQRIEKLTHESKANWGKMNVSQMLAHLNVSYDLAYERIVPKYNFIMKILLKTVVKKMVTNDVTYKPNGRTAPVFVIADERDFNKEKSRLIENMNQAFSDGMTFFDGRVSSSFGKMTVQEWSNQFYKHLDHHLRQFGV
jgi:hypothetical protein